MTRLAKYNILAASVLALSLSASGALAIDMPAEFTALDGNADARVEFSEFAAFAKTQGLSPTLAAQHFTKISAGDAVITEDEFFLASATGSYMLSSAPAYGDTLSAPMAPLDSTVETVEPVSAVTYETVETDAVSFEAAPDAAVPPAQVEPEADDGSWTDITTADTTEDLPQGALITVEPNEDVAGEVESFESAVESETDDATALDVEDDPFVEPEEDEMSDGELDEDTDANPQDG